MSISIYLYIYSFFRFFSHIDYYRILRAEFPVKHPGFQCLSPPSVLGQYSPLSQMPLAVSHPVCCSKCHDPEA